MPPRATGAAIPLLTCLLWSQSASARGEGSVLLSSLIMVGVPVVFGLIGGITCGFRGLTKFQGFFTTYAVFVAIVAMGFLILFLALFLGDEKETYWELVFTFGTIFVALALVVGGPLIAISYFLTHTLTRRWRSSASASRSNL